MLGPSIACELEDLFATECAQVNVGALKFRMASAITAVSTGAGPAESELGRSVVQQTVVCCV